jgi:predicted ATPase
MLVEEFARQVPPDLSVAIASCESDALPGPFSGVHDLADALGSSIPELLREQVSRERFLREFFDVLKQMPGPNVLVGEDSHHTDEASLELIRFLGRRIGQTQTLFIVTYREDALHPRHPLRPVMGDLVNAPDVYRMSVSPLSMDAVSALASDSDLDPGALHERTGVTPSS